MAQVLGGAEVSSMVFSAKTMASLVSSDTVAALDAANKNGENLTRPQRNEIAQAMASWATSKGAVQFAHYFSPVRGNAPGFKMDAFMSVDFGAKDWTKPLPLVAPEFDGNQLMFAETDGSSFPNGGIRDTHEAAAFLAWDRTAPCWVRNKTLFIPAIFITWKGAAEDHRLPLLRANKAICDQQTRLLKLLGYTDVDSVVCNVGPEQEFFLITREHYLQRPDLVNCGRTLIGAKPALNQQFCTHYFGQPPAKVLKFFDDFREECWRLGVSAMVGHNEVAPGQHEWSPIFNLTNVAADQNNLCMQIMDEVANNNGLVCLLHEKPFAGINGSGKHCNWGMNTNTGRNLYVPGKNNKDQACFIAQVACMARAVKEHGDLLRVGIADAGNDHRLGAQEAPPAILSLYVGKGLEAHLRNVVDGAALEGYSGTQQRTVKSGCNNVGDVPTGVEDRNRTAPIPWCGNRFEFRAVGSKANISWPLTLLETAVADSAKVLADAIEGGKPVREAVAAMLKDAMPAVFSGDGYSSEWHEEAESRGLPHLRNTPEAAAVLTSDKNTNLLTSHNIFSSEEVAARQSVMYETYVDTITCEANTLVGMLNTGAIPAAARDLVAYGDMQIDAVSKRKSALSALERATADVEKRLQSLPDQAEAATYCADTLKPAMDAARKACDTVEGLVRADLWPFPTYREMLFNHVSAPA